MRTYKHYTSCGFDSCQEPATGYADWKPGEYVIERRTACDLHGSDGTLKAETAEALAEALHREGHDRTVRALDLIAKTFGPLTRDQIGDLTDGVRDALMDWTPKA